MHQEHLHIYRIQTHWTGASHGATTNYRSYSREYTHIVDGKPPLRGSADPTFRGDASLHNPEELLVMALSSCHMLSYLALCARAGISVVSYTDNAIGKMTDRNGKICFTEVKLHPQVAIASKENLNAARELHHQAHEECFIANSVAFPVLHEPIVYQQLPPS